MILFEQMSCSKLADAGRVLSDSSGFMGARRGPHWSSVLDTAEKHEPTFWSAITALRKITDGHQGPSHLRRARDSLLAAAAAVGRLSVSEVGTTKEEVAEAIAAARTAATPLIGFKLAVLRAANALLAIYEVVADQHDARAPHYRVRDAEHRVALLEHFVQTEGGAKDSMRRLLIAVRNLIIYMELDQTKKDPVTQLLRTIMNSIAMEHAAKYSRVRNLNAELEEARAELAEARLVVEQQRAACRPSEVEVAREAELWRRLRTPSPIATPVSQAIAVAVEVGEGGAEGLVVADAVSYMGEAYAVGEEEPAQCAAVVAPVATSTLRATARQFIPRARREAEDSYPSQ